MRAPLTPEVIDAFRAELVALATRLYAEGGLDAVSVRNLAREAGVSRTTPYNYFRDKREIIDAIRAAGFDRLTARCRDELAGLDSPLDQMRALVWGVVRFAGDEPAIYQLMFSRPVFTGAQAAVLAAAIERFREVSRPPLDEAIRRGLVRGDPDAIRRTTWAAFHGLVSLYLQEHIESPEQLASDFETLNHIIGFGILTASAKGAGEDGEA